MVNDDGDLIALNETEDGEPEYTHKPYIAARAEIEDKITVFSVEEGALLQFDDIAHIRISPTLVGKIGGNANATIFDGIGFSGMSSTDVPEKGLMDGEPGRLWLNTEPFPEPSRNAEPNLQLELYLDEPQFEDLFSKLLGNLEKVEKATMKTVIELFENEVQASLNEPWMTSEYGLLKRDDKDWVSGRARIDWISITYSSLAPILSPPVNTDEDENKPRGDQEPHIFTNVGDHLTRTMHSIQTRLGWIIGLVALLIVILIATTQISGNRWL